MLHNIPEEELIERSENSVLLKVKIDSESDYFDGHFPDFKLLPALAQIDLLSHFAQKYFSLPLSTPNIKRFKFTDKILPDSIVIFKISFDSEKKRVTFEIRDAFDDRLYSSGVYSL
ncbi:MAG: hydroxymyristoyl-ACP dehydratase [Treponema sp.]|nr:hydroxymyristoyl-ACP dehydratase [Treponema sp.]